MSLDEIKKAEDVSKDALDRIRTALKPISDDDFSLMVSGSYGRHEATSGSDLDYFLLFRDDVSSQRIREVNKSCNETLVKLRFKRPSADGAFSSIQKESDIATQIGGMKDDNGRITRRILFLTESKCASICSVYDQTLNRLIERYISDDISEHQLALFLLNDLIRYYRTICVDFENKTVENGKDWGIRNIKLVFSRKLLYFGGVLMVAETAQRTAKDKRAIVEQLARLTPIERISLLFGDSAKNCMDFYDRFLGYLDDPEIRHEFVNTTNDRSTHSDLFRRVKNEGQHFSLALLSLLKSRYSEYHPVHKSLLI